MPLYTHDSLVDLKNKIDLKEVLEEYIDLKPSGANLKACCPFHEEKTPSFVVGRSSTHYHCFGCGAHGDAIAFIMEYLRLDFCQAIELLAQKFRVTLRLRDSSYEKVNRSSRVRQREIMQHACEFYLHNLLRLESASEAIDYLEKRGINLEFINEYQIGLACKPPISLKKYLNSMRYSDKEIAELGLISRNKQGRWRDFFIDRIMFPVHDSMGNIVAFSARKYLDTTQGGKYINSPETPLFKKNALLYALNYCRRRIVREHRAILVEGQVDALQMVEKGLNFTVAALGTAFGSHHANELLKLGVKSVHIVYDGDTAGRQAAVKVGDLLIKEGLDVYVVDLGVGNDPDSFMKAYGVEALLSSITNAMPYLNFIYYFFAGQMNAATPAGKQSLIKMISDKINAWSQPILIHESQKKLAALADVPISIINSQNLVPAAPKLHKASKAIPVKSPYQSEREVLQLVLQLGATRSDINNFVFSSLTPDCFHDQSARKIFILLNQLWEKNGGLSTLALSALIQEESLFGYFEELVSSVCPKEKWQEHTEDLVFYLLRRQWYQKRELIRQKLNEGMCSEEEAWKLLKEFQSLKEEPVYSSPSWDRNISSDK